MLLSSLPLLAKEKLYHSRFRYLTFTPHLLLSSSQLPGGNMLPDVKILVLLCIVFATGEACNQQDLKGLLGFKAKIYLDTSGRLDTWAGQDCCKWQGITCSAETERVTELRLPGFISSEAFFGQTKMEGQLSPSITLLTALQVIDLSELIGLSGRIPLQIGFHLPDLQKLHLHRNMFTGPIPESIGNLLKLEEILLYENRLSGSLPSTLGRLASLTTLHIYSNRLSGSIPDSITSLTKLQRLDLHGNMFAGHVPDDIGRMQAMEELDLSCNLLSGQLPLSLTNLTVIRVLYLDSNQLEGKIPFPSNSNQMQFLVFLRLQNNRLSGRIPPTFGTLISLQRVSLANNELQGPIPSSFGNLASATEIYLNGNRLSGQIPKSIGRLSRLMFFNVANNLLQGSLPSELSSLQNLQTIDLSSNLLNISSVPKWLAHLPSLCRIYLAGCGIQGEMPEVLSQMRSPILELDLSANHLTGIIPSWVGSFSQLYLLNLSKNTFVSRLRSTFINLQDLGVIDLHSNGLTGPIDQIFKTGSRFPGGSLTFVDLSGNKFSGGVEGLGMGMQTRIEKLNLSHNLLTGPLPISIRSLKSAKDLDLSFNKLGCRLPEFIADLTQLETLELQHNRFTGAIPNGFLNLKRLRKLDLSNNLLAGRIPAGKPFSGFPQSSYGGNIGLCGEPLPPCKV